jgi:predicted methyltransferase
MASIPSACRITNIVRKDAMILPQDANLSRMEFSERTGATAAYFNRAVFERLKPGGFYVIVDHAAAVGAGTGDAQSLHRIEPASVRGQVEAAGFKLDAETSMLTNKDDPHSTKVFDPSIRGETDRFAYRFVKL